jgi:uncharacterized membrane protein YfcA
VDPVLIASLLVLGAAVGFCAGLLGIGGGMLMVPFITLLLDAHGFAPEHVVHMAIATSLATICFTSLSSVRAHHRRGAVLWPVALRFTPGILIGSWLGAMIATHLNTRALAATFAIFVGFSATQMLLDKKPKPHRDLPGPAGMLLAGGTIGVLSGLVGAGGGFVSVPFMTWCNVRIHNAVATSAALGFPIALAGTFSYVYQGWAEPGLPSGAVGFIYLPALLVISIASVLTAALGARAAHALDVKALKRVFAGLLYCLAAYMAWKSLRS